MRKYRGLTKKGKWVYGWYVKCRGEHYILPLHNPDDPESSFDERWIQEGADEDGWFEVIPETVGQYASLKDKVLWEGDICKAEWNCQVCFDNEPHELTGTIEWGDDGLWMFDYGHGSVPLAAEELEISEIIGNIHESPELLEQGQ